MTKVKKQYCTICGKELKMIISSYDGDTGKPIFIPEECPVRDCAHGYHKYRSIGFLDIFNSDLWNVSKICKICGHKIYDGGDCGM